LLYFKIVVVPLFFKILVIGCSAARGTDKGHVVDTGAKLQLKIENAKGYGEKKYF